jgi:hypothetical protein
MFARDQRSSLLVQSIGDEREKFCGFDTGSFSLSFHGLDGVGVGDGLRDDDDDVDEYDDVNVGDIAPPVAPSIPAPLLCCLRRLSS